MNAYLIAPVLIFIVLLLWVGITHAARLFAFRHPQLGDAREEGGECGISCGCKHQDHCPARTKQKEITPQNDINYAKKEKEPAR